MGKVANKLLETTSKAFKGKDISFGSNDYEMMRQLNQNAFHFSSAKNYQQIKSISSELVDKNGKIRTFKAFREESAKINKVYNESWLRTEYETALGSAENAARWTELTAQGEKTLLTYDAVGDERTRHSHKALNGVTKPANDPFWNTHMPPNGWRCRCGITASPIGRKITKDSSIEKTPIPTMFRTNLAKDGVLFPKTHPYFVGAPKDIRAKGDRILIKHIQGEVIVNFKGEVLKAKALKGEVQLTTKGIKEAINQPHYDHVAKANSLLKIDEILLKAEYVESVENFKKDTNIKLFHYLSFMMKDKENYIVIKEDLIGNYYLYSIVDSIYKAKK